MPVYMIQGESRFGPVKIGHSHDPEIRLGQLQISHWEELRIIRRFEGGETEENFLHDQFRDLHIRGEWHSFSRAMLGYVGLAEVDAPAVIKYARSIQRPVSIERPPVDMVQHTQLLCEIEDFLSTRKMAETTFGRMAVNDGKFVARLRSGANMTLATIERVRAHIEAKRAVEVMPNQLPATLEQFRARYTVIVSDLERGLTSGQIARKRGLSASRICQIAERAGVRLPAIGRPRVKPMVVVVSEVHR